jgi:hypothetical protein
MTHDADVETKKTRGEAIGRRPDQSLSSEA